VSVSDRSNRRGHLASHDLVQGFSDDRVGVQIHDSALPIKLRQLSRKDAVGRSGRETMPEHRNLGGPRIDRFNDLDFETS
jgi:hypothetical protein